MQYAIVNADTPNHTDKHTVLTTTQMYKSHHTHTRTLACMHTCMHTHTRTHTYTHTHTYHIALYKPPPHTATTATHRPLTCKTTTSTSCKGSRPSWVPVGAQDAATKLQLAPKPFGLGASCNFGYCMLLLHTCPTWSFDPVQFALVVFSCTNYVAHLLMCTHDLPCCHCTLQLALVVLSHI